MKQPKLPNGHHYFTNDHGERVCTGAWMGRRDVTPEHGQPWPFLHLHRMRMNSGGAYDNGGAYWGAGDWGIGWMYIAFDKEGDVLLFQRAIDRRAAMVKLKNRYGSNLKFHNDESERK